MTSDPATPDGLVRRAGDRQALAELFAGHRDWLRQLVRLDREVLTLRQFEQLSNGETAPVLGIRKWGASARRVRGLKRLKEILPCVPGFDEEAARGDKLVTCPKARAS